MDGTLIDTEPYWIEAERELVTSFGAEWSPQDGFELVGQGLEVSAASLQTRGVDLPTEDIIDRLTMSVLAQTRDFLPWRPGALELLLAIREAGIPTALVTMSMTPLAEYVARSGGVPLFDLLVTGDTVEHSKPHPDPYERAARLLGVDIESCVAIEDSIPGLASATAAGAVVIGVPAHVPLPEATNFTLWPTLAGRTVDDLVATFQSSRNANAVRTDLV